MGFPLPPLPPESINRDGKNPRGVFATRERESEEEKKKKIAIITTTIMVNGGAAAPRSPPRQWPRADSAGYDNSPGAGGRPWETTVAPAKGGKTEKRERQRERRGEKNK